MVKGCLDYIQFLPFAAEHLLLYFKWAEKEHVKSEWFRDGYKPVDAIIEKLKEGSDAFPFIIQVSDCQVGFIQYYYFTEDTVGFDIFIGEEAYINKGYGTEIVKSFAKMLFAIDGVNKIIVDPFITNKQAQRCYEKAGFTVSHKEIDKIGTEVIIMELKK